MAKSTKNSSKNTKKSSYKKIDKEENKKDKRKGLFSEENMERNLNVLSKVIKVCIIIVSIEAILMLILFLFRRSKIIYLDNLNKIYPTETGYVGVGSTNAKGDKFTKKEKYSHYVEEDDTTENIIKEQAIIAIYNEKKKLTDEISFSTKYDSTFYDVLVLEDSYITVGSYVSKASQIDLMTRDGLIVKFDKNGKIIWKNRFQILGDTEFYRIKEDTDGYVVVGQSIYENMEIGNHDGGGGIIVKYDKNGEVIWSGNHGGNKSGSFFDFVKVNNEYYCVGKDGSNYGVIVKFDSNGSKIKYYNTYYADYSFKTDNFGFTSVTYYDNKLYISGTIDVTPDSEKKENSEEETLTFDGAIFMYDLDLNYKDKFTFGGNDDEYIKNFIIYDDTITMVGYTSGKDMFKSAKIENNTGLIIKSDLNGKMISKDYYGGKGNDIINDIIFDSRNNKYVMVGTSSSKNKKDYKRFIIEK